MGKPTYGEFQHDIDALREAIDRWGWAEDDTTRSNAMVEITTRIDTMFRVIVKKIIALESAREGEA